MKKYKKRITKNYIRTCFWAFSLCMTFVAVLLAAETAVHVELPKEGAETLLYANQTQDDLTQTYVQTIKSAEKSILLLIYGLSDPSIIYALKSKASSGIDLMVICDGEATPQAKQALGSAAKVFPIYDKGLMHLKILVVDRKIVLVGSANLTKHSLKIHGNLVLGFESPDIAQFIEMRAKEIITSHPDTIQLLHQNFIVGNQQLEFWFLPGNNQSVNRIVNLIDGAKKTIRVAMFTFTRHDFAEALIRAQKRGVNVEVVIDKSSSKNASKKIARLLQRSKIPIFINTDMGLEHHKFLYIDQKTLVNGSANWTKAAFTQNNDCFIVLDRISKIQQKKMNQLWKNILAEAETYIPR